MSVILKLSRLALRTSELYRGSNVFLFKKRFLLNSVTNKQFCSVTSAEISKISTNKNESEDAFNTSMAILDFQMSLSRRHNIDVQKFDEIFELLKQKEQITLHETTLLIKLCGNSSLILKSAERQALVKKVVSNLEDLGVNLTISDYDTILSIYLRTNTKVSPQEFLKKLEEKGIQPSQLTFQYLLKILCYNGDMDQASELLELMKKKQIAIGEDVFNSLIYGHGKVQDMQSAVEILKIMEQKDLQASNETYCNLICGYVVQGNVNEVEKIFKQCEEKQILFDHEHFLHILYVAAICNENSLITNMINEIKKKSYYTKVAQHYILRLLENNCDATVFKLIDSIEGGAYKTNHAKFTINYFCKYRPVMEIYAACEALIKACNFSALSLAAETLFRMKDDSKYLTFLENFVKRYNCPNANNFWPLIINAFKISNEQGLKVLDRMRRMHVPIDYATASRIIRPNYKFGVNLEPDFENLNNVGVRPSYICRSIVLDYVMKGDIDGALNTARLAPCSMSRTNSIAFFNKLNWDADKFVTLLHILLHDYYDVEGSLKPLQLEEETETETEAEAATETETEAVTETDSGESQKSPRRKTRDIFTANEFARVALHKWIQANKPDESSLLKALKGMLDMGINISVKEADSIEKDFRSTEIKDLLKKLKSEELKMRLDDKILIAKNKFLDNVANRSDQVMVDKLMNLTNLVKENKVEEAMNQLSEENFSANESNHLYSETYRQFMWQLFKLEKLEEVQKAFKFGVDLKFLTPDDNLQFVFSLLRREKHAEAVDLYCKTSEASRSLERWDAVGKRIMKLENSDLLQKLVDTFAEVKSEEIAAAYLISLFSMSVKEKEILKTLDSVKTSALSRTMNIAAAILQRKNSEHGLQCLLNASIPSELREPVYRGLARLYLRRGNTNKMEELVYRLHEDGIVPSVKLTQLLKSFYKKSERSGFFKENFERAKAV